MTLSELVRAVEGNDLVLRRIMALTWKPVASNLRGLGWPPDLHDDAILVAYHQLSRKSHTISDPTQVVAWLTSVAKRHIMRTVNSHEVAVGLNADLQRVACGPLTHGRSDLGLDSGLLEHLAEGLTDLDLEIVQHLALGFRSLEVAGILDVAPRQVLEVRERAKRLVQNTEWDPRSRTAAIIADPQPAAEQHSIVENAIRTLPPRQREVLNYNVYGGLAPCDIARQLGITANSARVSLHQARSSLADRLQLSPETIKDMLDLLSTIAASEPDGPDASVETHPEMIVIAFDVARLRQRSKRLREAAQARLGEIVADVLPGLAELLPAGDAVLVLQPLNTWAPGYVASLTMRIQRALAANNARHVDRLNLRVLVDVGTVNGGGRAFSSQLVINQLRLIESEPVRDVTNASAAALAMFTSPRVHELTIRAPGHALPENMAFGQPIIIVDKSYQTLKAWPLLVTDHRVRSA
ncbi:RNA polymerase sigma factor [Amycolatopsis sp. lyj-109]|uniref:RNA polymerase sigma factor n=1 Tax=Amycolatopsis sp. lyj-109 TaxID=2789287 RepID=UPI00397A0B88